MAEVTKQPVGGQALNGANAPTASTEPVPPAAATSIIDVSSDRCPSCGADLATDQRYCVECGHRRGRPRYTLAAPEPAVPVVREPAPPRGRFSPGSALLAGLAMLLLALGVGVLIGHNGNSAGGRQPVNVTVGAGAAAPSSGGTANLASAGGTSSGGHRSKSAKSGSHAKSAAQANKALPAAAKKVAAPAPLKKAAATASKHVTSTTGQSSIGSKCSGGAGCHNGKQTGVFFGG